MLTLKTVNREIQKSFPEFELFKGDNLFYIVGPNTELWDQTSVYTYRINHLTLAQWVEEVKYLINRNKDR